MFEHMFEFIDCDGSKGVEVKAAEGRERTKETQWEVGWIVPWIFAQNVDPVDVQVRVVALAGKRLEMLADREDQLSRLVL